MDILTNNIKVKYQTHDRIYLVIEEDLNNRTGKLNRKFPRSKNTLNDRVDKKLSLTCSLTCLSDSRYIRFAQRFLVQQGYIYRDLSRQLVAHCFKHIYSVIQVLNCIVKIVKIVQFEIAIILPKQGNSLREVLLGLNVPLNSPKGCSKSSLSQCLLIRADTLFERPCGSVALNSDQSFP